MQQANHHHQDLFFVTPDEHIEIIRDIAMSLGFEELGEPTGLFMGDRQVRRGYTSDFAGVGVRYDMGLDSNLSARSRSIVFLPLSWTGIGRDELHPLAQCLTNFPCTIWTVRLPSVCMAFWRMAQRAGHQSRLYEGLFSDLVQILGHQYFWGPDRQHLTKLENMDWLIREIDRWTFRSDEESMRETFVGFVITMLGPTLRDDCVRTRRRRGFR
jgi:hypothetical protein